MKNKLIYFLVVALIITGFLNAVPAVAESTGKLVIYSSVPTVQLNMITDMFTTQYPGIVVDIFSAQTAEVMQQVSKAPQGDVVLGGGLSDFEAIEAGLSSYVSPNRQEIYQGLQNDSNSFTPYQVHVSVMVVNVPMAKGLNANVTSWESLTDDKLSGKIAYMDSAATSPDAQQSDFINSFANALELGKPSAPSFVVNAVTAGQCAVGITNEEKAIERLKAGSDLKVIYADDGTAMGASYTGILKDAPNEANAKLFIDFMTSKAYQQAATDRLNQRSVRSDVNFNMKEIAATEMLQPMNMTKALNINELCGRLYSGI
ncbi:MAG: extracellular solute-binding protein [Clostridiales bacterium]|nr:extracellular solute-binding protein [Clostridiales bacterium]